MRVLRNDLIRLHHDLRRASARLEPEVLRPVATYASTRIAGRAVGTYMRDAKGGGRRSRTDTGPLRILTGRAARSLTGGGGSRDSVQQVRVDGDARLTLIKGSRAPGIVFNEERTAVSGARLATLRPATEQELPGIRDYAGGRMQALMAREVR